MLPHKVLLTSGLPSYSCIDVDEVIRTRLQALTVRGKEERKKRASISSFKDAQELVHSGESSGWGSVPSLPDNKARTGLGFSLAVASRSDQGAQNLKEVFRSAGFVNCQPPPLTLVVPKINIVIEKQSQQEQVSAPIEE